LYFFLRHPVFKFVSSYHKKNILARLLQILGYITLRHYIILTSYHHITKYSLPRIFNIPRIIIYYVIILTSYHRIMATSHSFKSGWVFYNLALISHTRIYWEIDYRVLSPNKSTLYLIKWKQSAFSFLFLDIYKWNV
jgi:hypothetical protein